MLKYFITSGVVFSEIVWIVFSIILAVEYESGRMGPEPVEVPLTFLFILVVLIFANGLAIYKIDNHAIQISLSLAAFAMFVAVIYHFNHFASLLAAV